jgi:putative ABC transport system ATP-binding protein
MSLEPLTTPASSEGSLIEIDHLTKVYQLGEVEVHALRGVSVHISRGEFVAIMGASGSGKSTFMNILGCLDKPTKGTYILEGIDVGKLTRDELAAIRNKKIGFVFQGFNLLSRTSAMENVELPMFYSTVSNKLRKTKAIEALEKVGLGDRIHHYPNQLSGGQQQRVAIARSLVNDPSIILADEPTGNLDSRTSVEVMGIFQELNSHGITIILVTHEPDIAQFAKRHVVFRDGKIRADKINSNPKVAAEVIKEMPMIDEDEEEAAA